MHEGHRSRMYQKLKNDDSLRDHEILEMMLYNALPRVNTNPLAHNLIDAFGSLSGVFSAGYNKLIAVEGVGRNVAEYLMCVGECYRRITADTAYAVLSTPSDFKTFTASRMRGKRTEYLELYCLDKQGKITGVYSYTETDKNKVEVSSEKIASVLASAKPYGLVAAHNHIIGNSTPSISDDKFTAQIQILCSLNNIRLYDHCIYASDEDMYSYYQSGKIDAIKKDFNIGTLMDGYTKKLTGGGK